MMFSVNSSLSALMAYGKKMGVHANNISNMYSKDFSKSRAILREGVDQTVTVDIEQVESSTYPITGISDSQLTENESNPSDTTSVEDSLAGNTSNNVDLATEMVETNIAQNGYKANLKIIQKQDEMVGTILDMLS
jgi:flagellar basal body rod protein FlgC